MDILSGLRSEILRPALTLLIPGLVAGAPIVFVLQHYQPGLLAFADDHPTLSTFLSLAASAMFGMVTSDLGTHIESCLDRLLLRRDKAFEEEWYGYLRCTFPEKPVAYVYVHDRVLYLHFELAMAAALPISLIGTIWAWAIRTDFSCVWFFWTVLALVVGGAFFVKEAYSTAKLLGKVRKHLLKGVGQPPFAVQGRQRQRRP